MPEIMEKMENFLVVRGEASSKRSPSFTLLPSETLLPSYAFRLEVGSTGVLAGGSKRFLLALVPNVCSETAGPRGLGK